MNKHSNVKLNEMQRDGIRRARELKATADTKAKQDLIFHYVSVV